MDEKRDLLADLALCELALNCRWLEQSKYLTFDEAARSGWPHAIRRAMEAEEELQRKESKYRDNLERQSERTREILDLRDWQRRAVEVIRRLLISGAALGTAIAMGNAREFEQLSKVRLEIQDEAKALLNEAGKGAE